MSNAYKEVGTLKEIGAQVGDVVTNSTDNCNFNVIDVQESARLAYKIGSLCDDGGIWISGIYEDWRIISRAQPGPVRTVTRLEIVPGKYGNVTVWGDGWPSVKGVSNIDELTDAIATLTAIRDAMQANNMSPEE